MLAGHLKQERNQIPVQVGIAIFASSENAGSHMWKCFHKGPPHASVDHARWASADGFIDGHASVHQRLFEDWADLRLNPCRNRRRGHRPRIESHDGSRRGVECVSQWRSLHEGPLDRPPQESEWSRRNDVVSKFQRGSRNTAQELVSSDARQNHTKIPHSRGIKSLSLQRGRRTVRSRPQIVTGK